MLEVTYKQTQDLIKYSNNSRTHSNEQVLQIVESIKEFGFTNPILIDEDNNIIAGHGRLMASEILNLTEVPTITLKGLTEAQKRAYIIADNSIALNSGWDEDLLQLELIALDELGFDYSNLGFDFDLDIEQLDNEQDYSNKNKEIDVDSYDDVMELKFKLTFSEYNQAKEKLSEISSNPENALKILLKMEV